MPRLALVRVVVRHLDELERVAVRILEVDPAPAGEHALVDDVDVAEELDALGLELGLLGVDVVDEEADVGGAEAVRHERPLGLARRALVLQELEHRVAEQQAHLSQRAAGNADGLPEVFAVEPRARLVGELEAEDVVVEADRRLEILDGDADVVQTLHGSSVQSSFVVRG